MVMIRADPGDAGRASDAAGSGRFVDVDPLTWGAQVLPSARDLETLQATTDVHVIVDAAVGAAMLDGFAERRKGLAQVSGIRVILLQE